MKSLTSSDLKKMLREEYKKKTCDIDLTPYAGQDTGSEIAAQGLKLRHKDTHLLYTVLSVSTKDIVLRTPEGDPFTLSKEEVSRSYVLD